METQQALFPNLKKDGEPKIVTEADAKEEAAKLLTTLLEAGFVNVKNEDVSDEHLKDLIKTLRE